MFPELFGHLKIFLLIHASEMARICPGRLHRIIDVSKQRTLHVDLILKCQVVFKHLNALRYLHVT